MGDLLLFLLFFYFKFIFLPKQIQAFVPQLTEMSQLSYENSKI